MAHTLTDVAQRYGLELWVQELPKDEDGTTNWKVRLMRGTYYVTTPYRMGSAITGMPQIEDVMDSLRLDAEAGRMTFEDFCGEFGYDTDSRKAFSIHQQCHKIANRLDRFLWFPKGLREMFLEAESL